jgi:hypothetical protein
MVVLIVKCWAFTEVLADDGEDENKSTNGGSELGSTA